MGKAGGGVQESGEKVEIVVHARIKVLQVKSRTSNGGPTG